MARHVLLLGLQPEKVVAFLEKSKLPVIRDMSSRQRVEAAVTAKGLAGQQLADTEADVFIKKVFQLPDDLATAMFSGSLPLSGKRVLGVMALLREQGIETPDMAAWHVAGDRWLLLGCEPNTEGVVAMDVSWPGNGGEFFEDKEAQEVITDLVAAGFADKSQMVLLREPFSPDGENQQMPCFLWEAAAMIAAVKHK